MIPLWFPRKFYLTFGFTKIIKEVLVSLFCSNKRYNHVLNTNKTIGPIIQLIATGIVLVLFTFFAEFPNNYCTSLPLMLEEVWGSWGRHHKWKTAKKPQVYLWDKERIVSPAWTSAFVAVKQGQWRCLSQWRCLWAYERTQ